MKLRVSASQFATFRDCPKKWWFDKVEKRPTPAHPAAALGKSIHDDLEEYFGGKKRAPEMREGQALLQILPKPSEDYIPEKELEFFLFPDIGVKGFVDLWRLNTTPEIYDYKSTANVNRYHKTAEDLTTDPQAVIYGYGARIEAAKVLGMVPDNVALRWCYVQTKTNITKPPPILPVDLVQSKMMMEDGLALLEGDANKMVDASLTKRVEDLDGPADKETCHKYGGCYHRDVCGWYQEQRLMTISRKQKDTQVDSALLAKLAALSGTPMPPPATPTPEPAAPPPQPPRDAPAPPPSIPPMDSPAATATGPVVSADSPPDVSPEDPAPEVTQPAPTPTKRARKSAKPVEAVDAHEDKTSDESVKELLVRAIRAALEQSDFYTVCRVAEILEEKGE